MPSSDSQLMLLVGTSEEGLSSTNARNSEYAASRTPATRCRSDTFLMGAPCQTGQPGVRVRGRGNPGRPAVVGPTMTTGAWVLIVAVVAALAFGLYRAAADGRFRGTRRLRAEVLRCERSIRG